MGDFPRKLVEIAEQIEKRETPEKVTVRMLLDWFGAQRRGFYVVQNIRNTLEKLGIRTDPDFESAFIDSLVQFEAGTAPSNPDGSLGGAEGAVPPVHVDAQPILVGGGITDPTYRIGKLASANNTPLAVRPDTTLREAVTLMLSHDYSQLPVTQNERDVKGVVSWSSIGSRVALGRACNYVRECMEPSREISADTSLFAAIDTIVKFGYVLIRDPARRVSGIVTPSDLSLQFLQLGEPFLLLGEIENHIRRLVQGRFSASELAAARDPADGTREITDVSDLTFGEYIRLLEDPARWGKLGLPIDRGVVLAQLDRIRVIRNDVMHFDPDGIAPADLDALRGFVRFMQELQSIGVT